MAEFIQSGCIRAKMVVLRSKSFIWEKWLYSGKSGCIRAMWLYSEKVVVFGQHWLSLGKLVLLGQNLL